MDWSFLRKGACVSALILLLSVPSASGAAELDWIAAIEPKQMESLPSAEEPGRYGNEPDLTVRSIDGSWNNVNVPSMSAAFTPLERWLDPDYGDKVQAMAGADRPSPREISNVMSAQSESVPNSFGASDMLWQWGQFIDHDIGLTPAARPPEGADIDVPENDAHFEPGGVIYFDRSVWDLATGVNQRNPRQQVNQITGWIDASNVYGSDAVRAEALRELDGTGRLRVSEGDLLPWNIDGLPNDGGPSPFLFLAGDVRANEQPGLTALHTLFVREHNRLADLIGAENPGWSDEQIYQRARLLVGAEIQAITYNEFLPALLGPGAIPEYQGYRPSVNAGISNVFSTAAYRFGHSALNDTLLRLDAYGDEIPDGHLPLRDAFFNPDRILLEGGIDPLLRGLASQPCQEIDTLVVDGVRNFLFGEPGDGGFDLASLNIQRGRDHGLPSYNDARAGMGLEPVEIFADVTDDPEKQAWLAEVYDDVNRIDIWVGGLSEDPVPGSMLGELFHTIVAKQFAALRDGDRFWYLNVFSKQISSKLSRVRLSEIIHMNTLLGSELSKDVFIVESRRKNARK